MDPGSRSLWTALCAARSSLARAASRGCGGCLQFTNAPRAKTQRAKGERAKGERAKGERAKGERAKGERSCAQQIADDLKASRRPRRKAQ
jgi:hypothetical protein